MSDASFADECWLMSGTGRAALSLRLGGGRRQVHRHDQPGFPKPRAPNLEPRSLPIEELLLLSLEDETLLCRSPHQRQLETERSRR
eukprot:762091-Rhodomonas_salina.2